jgi:WD40 repeat protein
MQIEAHGGGVNDLAFAHPNKQLCIITCGDDKTIKVCYECTYFTHLFPWLGQALMLSCFRYGMQ